MNLTILPCRQKQLEGPFLKHCSTVATVPYTEETNNLGQGRAPNDQMTMSGWVSQPPSSDHQTAGTSYLRRVGLLPAFLFLCPLLPGRPAWAFVPLSAAAVVTPLAIYLKGWKHKMPPTPRPKAARTALGEPSGYTTQKDMNTFGTFLGDDDTQDHFSSLT